MEIARKYSIDVDPSRKMDYAQVRLDDGRTVDLRVDDLTDQQILSLANTQITIPDQPAEPAQEATVTLEIYNSDGEVVFRG